MSYTFDPKQARAADSQGSILRETGKYIGTITRAEALSSSSGARGMGISFNSNGQQASYLDLWTHNGQGEELPSLKTVHAILCCLRIKNVEEGQISFEKWDVQTRQNVKTQAVGFPALMGKQVGFLLRKELSHNQHGEDRETMGIYAVFEAQSELMASEILDRVTKPEKLASAVSALMAKPIYDRRKKPGSAPANASQQTQTSRASLGFDDMDDDIPF